MKFSSSSKVLRGCGRSSGRVIRGAKGFTIRTFSKLGQYALQFSLGSGYIAFIDQSSSELLLIVHYVFHLGWNCDLNADTKTADSVGRSFSPSRHRRSGRACRPLQRWWCATCHPYPWWLLFWLAYPASAGWPKASTSFESIQDLR